MSLSATIRPLFVAKTLKGIFGVTTRTFAEVNTPSTAKAEKAKAELKNPYMKDPVCCILCKHNVPVDYKNARLLSQFISPFTGKIYDQSMTGLCSEQHKRVESAIKQAQNAGYLATMLRKLEFKDDPVICNMNRRK